MSVYLLSRPRPTRFTFYYYYYYCMPTCLIKNAKTKSKPISTNTLTPIYARRLRGGRSGEKRRAGNLVLPKIPNGGVTSVNNSQNKPTSPSPNIPFHSTPLWVPTFRHRHQRVELFVINVSLMCTHTYAPQVVRHTNASVDDDDDYYDDDDDDTMMIIRRRRK